MHVVCHLQLGFLTELKLDYERTAGGYNLRNGQYKMRDMMSEEYRLSTFTNHWPHHSTPNLTGLQMARAGFYYEGQSDKVTCPYCRQWLNRWEKEDVPLVEHKTKFPDCKFVRGEVEEEKVGNDLIEDMDTDQEEQKKWDAAKQKDPNIIGEPCHPHNADKQIRIETFRNGTGCLKTAEALAEAGFFSTGTGDEVTCFYCSVTLNNWGGTDIPWVEHARESPKCPFVEEECGRFYINQVSGAIDREFVENLRQEAKTKGHSDHDITQALHNNGEPFWSEEAMREAVETLDYQRLAVSTQAAEHDEEEEIQGEHD